MQTPRAVTRFIEGRRANPYTSAFYQGQAEGSHEAAEAVVPLLVEMTRPLSVLDLGCGAGQWLSVFREHGVDVVGVDGKYVDRALLRIPGDSFLPRDLGRPIDLGRRFDLALSLEVGEHLPTERAHTLVDSLVRHSDVILFSAAIPRQRGSGHVNEQWQSYWARLFHARGYVALDTLRRRIWDNPRIHWWYRQNSLLYVNTAGLDRLPGLKQEWEVLGAPAVSVVHPGRHQKWRRRARGIMRA